MEIMRAWVKHGQTVVINTNTIIGFPFNMSKTDFCSTALCGWIRPYFLQSLSDRGIRRASASVQTQRPMVNGIIPLKV